MKPPPDAPDDGIEPMESATLDTPPSSPAFRPGRPPGKADATRRREDRWLARNAAGESAPDIALDSAYSLRTIQDGIKAARDRRDAGRVTPGDGRPDADHRRELGRLYGRSKDPAVQEWLQSLKKPRPGHD